MTVLGIDFDNTIVEYNNVFYEAAREKDLIPSEIDRTKSSVRNYLREENREDEWTKLQGYVYGKRMDLADPFPGFEEFLKECLSTDHEIRIVSHKTKEPYMGPAYDLHQAARDWLHDQQFIGDAPDQIHENDVFFEETLEKKLERIKKANCELFIDDLPEFLDEPEFPDGIEKILFDPNDHYEDSNDYRRVSSWREIGQRLP